MEKQTEILSFQKEFTVKELFTKLNQKDQAIGLTTIYRTKNTSFLKNSYVIIRISKKENKNVKQKINY